MAPQTADELPFTTVGGRLCLDFLNTVAWRSSNRPAERLTSYQRLVAWAYHRDALSHQEAEHLVQSAVRRRDEAEATLQQAISLRESMYQVFLAILDGRLPTPQDLNRLNAALAEALALMRLVPAEHRLTWSWTNDTALDRPLWPITRSAAELLTSAEVSRVRMCPGQGCGWLFLDTTKNQSRRWCDMDVCGNRTKVRRFLARRRSLGVLE